MTTSEQNSADETFSVCGNTASGTALTVSTSEFSISDTEYAFVVGISGLSWDDFSNTNSKYAGYYYQDDALIDAEKSFRVSTDNMMCWAGAAANLLYYTGWADGFGFTDESDVFDFFIDNFYLGDLYGGHAYYATEWFFTGAYEPAGTASYDQVLAGGGGYYSSEITANNIDEYMSYENEITVSVLTNAMEKLGAGYGVEISFSYYDSNNSRTGGHATTLWGFTYDTSLEVTDPNYYTGIIITDSDDDHYGSYDDPRDAPDTLKIIPITYDSSLSAYILSSAYSSNCRIDNIFFLAPNSAGLQPTLYETPKGVVKTYKSGSIVSSQGVVTGATVIRNGDVDRMCVYDGGTASNTVIGSKGYAAMSGGVMLDTTVNSSGQLFISGGTASRTTVNTGGSMHIYSGGSAESATVNSGGSMHIYNGGSTARTEINSRGRMYVHSGGTATESIVNSGGSMYVSSGGTATEVIVNSGGRMYVSSGGEASILFNPWQGSVTSATGAAVSYLDRDANIYFGSDGAFVSKTNETLSNCTVSEGGAVFLYESGRITGALTIETGGVVSAYEGSIIDFDLRDQVPEGTALINDLSLINGTPTYTITVNSTLGGVYVLAGNAASFAGTISVPNTTTGSSVTLTVNDDSPGRYYLYADTADNALKLEIRRDDILPEIVINPYTTEPTNQSIVISADFTDNDAVALAQYQINGGDWIDYKDGVTITRNGTVQFRAVDRAGNETVSEVITISNIDKDPPTFEVVLKQGALHDYSFRMTMSEDGFYQYQQNDGDWIDLDGDTLSITANGTYSIRAVDLVGNVSENIYTQTISWLQLENPAELTATGNGRVSWTPVAGENPVLVQYSADGFKTAVTVSTAATALDTLSLPQNVKVRVKSENSVKWTESADELIAAEDTAPQLKKAVTDGVADVFFARTDGKWDILYQAVHRGSAKGWSGTGERVSLTGKNKITDMFYGADDINILYLTDDKNGDVLFVDDIYSNSFEEQGKTTSRLANLNEIRAGVGDDIVDMTSEKFSGIGNGITIRGGDGNDVIWSNSGKNVLCGDAGNDRIVGASGKDVIVGGSGDDSMHGGGGNDIFTFGGNFGNDTVEQLSGESVTLWFENGAVEYWNAKTLTYDDGTNSVMVSGTASVTVKFGDDGSEQYDELVLLGAFADSTAQKVFADAEDADPVIAVL